MPNSNFGPSTSSFVNEVPLRGTFDTNGKLLQILGSGQSVAFDPANVAITGGTVNGASLQGSVPFNPANVAITGGAIGGVQFGEFLNFSASNLSKWRKGLAAVRSGTGNAKLAFIGDSRTQGAGVTLKTQSFPMQLRGQMQALGLVCQNESMFGTGGITLASAGGSFDPRLTFGTGWVAGGLQTVGGNTLAFNGVTDAALNFAASVNTDRVDVYYPIKSASGGQITLSVNGGASLGAFSGTGTASTGKASASFVSAANTLNITGNNTPALGNVEVIGFHMYTSTISSVQILQMGYGGSAIDNWTSQNASYGTIAALPVIAPALTVIDLTVNDMQAATSVTTFIAKTQLLINAALQTGDVVLMVGMPPSGTVTNFALFQNYVGAYKSLSINNNLPLIDLSARWASYAVSNPLGYYSDILHGTQTGYADVAACLAKALASV